MNVRSPTKKLRGERGPPPYFAGRKAELAAMRERLELALNERDSATDGMLLVTGVPGIGKTHLAQHFIHQQKKSKDVKALAISTNGATSPEGLLALIGRSMEAEGQFLRAAGIDDKVTGVRAGIAGTISGGVTLDAHRPSVDFFHMLYATKDLRAWRGKALVLVVDEVQNMDSRSADQVRILHEGQHGCPILTIAAGLQHSNEVLSNHGVSRMEHRRLGMLSPDEALAAIYHGLNNLGVNVNENAAQVLAEASMRFPHHVHAHIKAAVEVHIKRSEVNSQAALAETLHIARMLKERYYVGRMRAMGSADKLYPLIEHMVAHDATAVSRSVATSIVGDNTVDSAVHHGVLSSDEDRVLSFGIPSFRTYMIGRAARHRELTHSEGQEN